MKYEMIPKEFVSLKIYCVNNGYLLKLEGAAGTNQPGNEFVFTDKFTMTELIKDLTADRGNDE